ncbi:MAG: hypothetical protein WD270_11555 [Acetobacterales bacterium]
MNVQAEQRPGGRGGGRRAEAALWASWALGPLGWALHESASYALVTWNCGTVSYAAFHAVTVAALALAAAGGWLGWRALRRRRQAEGPEPRTGRQRFMAGVGLGICVFSFAGIVVESLPTLVLDACEGAT